MNLIAFWVYTQMVILLCYNYYIFEGLLIYILTSVIVVNLFPLLVAISHLKRKNPWKYQIFNTELFHIQLTLSFSHAVNIAFKNRLCVLQTSFETFKVTSLD
jgi:hypothetical protein